MNNANRTKEREESSALRLTGTMSEAIPTPIPEKNLPACNKAAFVPRPIISHPILNGRDVNIKAVLRPTKSINHPPRGEPIMAPMLRRDWRVTKVCNYFTPGVEPWVIQSFPTFDSMDRTLKCDHSLESC